MFGKIISVQSDRGFGFVRPNGANRDQFFHVSDLVGLQFSDELIGERCEFEIREVHGRERAVNVRPAEAM